MISSTAAAVRFLGGPARYTGVFWLALAGLLSAAEPAGPADPYLRVRPLPVQPALTPLPPGQVMPQGWLRDWCESMRDGLTGHLDEHDVVFKEGWKGVDFKARGGGKSGWPLEQCGYWLDGLVRLALVMHDEGLLAKARERLDPVVGNVTQEGPFSWWNPKWPGGFDAWGNAVLGRALVAYYAGTRKPEVLTCLERAYRAYPANEDLKRGAVNFESLAEAYTWGAEVPFAEKVATALQSPGVMPAVDAWRQGQIKGDHGVTYCETTKIPAIFYLAQKDKPELLQAAVKRFEWLEDNHMLPYGVPSAQEHLAGRRAFAHTETCDVADYTWTALWLYRITGGRVWGDRIERAFLNAGPATVSRDGKMHTYYQTPNRLSRSVPPKPGAGGGNWYAPTHPVLCCTGESTRILPNFVMHMWMATGDGGLAFALLGPCRVETTLKSGAKVKILCETIYPMADALAIRVQTDRPATFPLHLRAPEWCAQPAVTVNGAPAESPVGASGFIRLDREWKSGDVIRYRLPMSVRVWEGKETDGAPFASVYHGPLLYALPLGEKDGDPNTVDPLAKWNYALRWNRDDPAASFRLERREMPARWDWPSMSPVTLQAEAVRFAWTLDAKKPSLPGEPIRGAGLEVEKVALAPYGCTKFRVSMFPVCQSSTAP